MSGERKEPTVSAVLNTKEELVDRQIRAAARSTRSAAVRESDASTGGSSAFLWLTFLVTICAITVAGYAVWKLQTAEQALEDQRLRIISLEKKLTVSDDSAMQSIQSVGVKIRELNDKSKLAMSEIDKLWAARNVNRKAIKEGKEQLAALGKQQKNHTKTISTLNKRSDNLDKSVKSIASLKTTVEATSQTTSEQELLLQSLRERVKLQAKTLQEATQQADKGAEASAQLADLKKRLKASEESLKSLEAFRRTVNRDLLQLKQKQP